MMYILHVNIACVTDYLSWGPVYSAPVVRKQNSIEACFTQGTCVIIYFVTQPYCSYSGIMACDTDM